MYENIFEPIKIRNLEIKNRVVFAPTSMGYSKEEYLNKLINIASGEVGLIIIGDVSVVDSFHEEMITLSDDKHIDYFKKITDEIHKYGCKISAQLFHPDYDIDSIKHLINEKKIGREQIREIMKESMYSYVNDMSIEKISEIQEKFVKASVRAKKAGFDIIQVHGDRLLGSFSSSIFNNRNDEYGGSTENRAKMSMEIVDKIRHELYEMVIDYKLGIRKENPSIGKGGPSLKEVEIFVDLLDKAGVDSFHVAIANHSSIKDTIPANNHTYLNEEGCFLDLAKEVKKYTNKVVCTVGKLKTPDFINNILKNDVDMVGLSRQLIADDKWVIKVKEGRLKDIDYCRFCNIKCTNALMNRTSFGCILHDNNGRGL
jgi:2,4-dienoyl-CoA reductase-like NADH-dependent reductase (Old Yellow Enzyme family)